ncbi:Dirigent protein 23-like protein [Drosera capensis]
MAKATRSLVMIAMLSLMAITHWSEAESWGDTVDSGQQKTTTLLFYFHDIMSGKNPSVVMVAQAQASSKFQTFFGGLFMADDLLTVSQDPASKLVGRAQGLYGSASRGDLGLIMALSYSFTDGIYNGSSISILGRNAAMQPVREMPVVGGTGIFRMARGYALARTVWMNFTTGDAIVQYNVTVVH